MKEKDKLMVVKEVCQYLKISRSTLYRLINADKIPAFRVGDRWRFRFEEINKFFIARSLSRPRYFKIEALARYRAQPEKYNLKEDARGAWLELHPNYRAELIRQGKRREIFDLMRIHRMEFKTCLPDGQAGLPNRQAGETDLPARRSGGSAEQAGLMITPDDFNRLPRREQRGWAYYEID